jgi:hypothetical protein
VKLVGTGRHFVTNIGLMEFASLFCAAGVRGVYSLTGCCWRNHRPFIFSVIKAVGVEKLILCELVENSSRQEALQTIFPDRMDIFYHRI